LIYYLGKVKYYTPKILKTLLLFSFFLQIEIVFSQNHNLYFEHYSTQDGLSQNIINSITQDNKGFIWIATQTGINKFDGYNFQTYNKEADNSNSLISCFVRHLTVDKNDRLWIGTVAGLNCYDICNDKFYLYQSLEKNKKTLTDNFINYTYVDKAGYLWVATQNGLNKSKINVESITNIKEANIEFEQYLKSNSISNNEVNSIYEDSKNNIWVCTNNGLNKFDNKTGKIVQIFYNNSEANKANYNRINRIIEINKSLFFVATDGGLLSYNPKTNLFESFANNTFFLEHEISSEINDLSKDKYNNIWIGTGGDGLICYNSNNKKFSIYKKQTNNLHSLQHNYINTLYFDKSSTLFVGLHNGISSTKLSNNNFITHKYSSSTKNNKNKNMAVHVAYQNQETIWLATLHKGLEKFNLKTNSFKKYKFKEFYRDGINILVQNVLIEDENNLWLGTQKNGLLLFNHKTGNIKQFKYKKNGNSIPSNNVYWLNKDKSNNLWIATFRGGLSKFNLKTSEFKNYYKYKYKNKPFKLNFITKIEFDKDSLLWISTFGEGLICLNTKTEKIIHYKHNLKDTNSISSDFCITMHFGKDGKLWLGTTAGIDMFDKKTNKFINFNKTDGLPDLSIYSIEEDNKNNLWISTNYGLSRFNKKNNNFTNFTVKDGLQNNEFNSGVSLNMPDGRMFFGGIEGFNIFNPDSIIIGNYKAKINITNLKLFYNDVEIKKKYNNDILLTKSIAYTDTIILNHKNNVISIEFAAIDYKNSNKIKYAFILEGFEKEWNFTNSNKRFATYTNLDYGTYTFKVKSTNSDGIWNKKGKKLTIIIKASFWQTIYAKLLLLVLFISIVVFVARVRTKILQNQKNILEKQVKDRTRIIERQEKKIKERYREVLEQKEDSKQQTKELLLLTNLLDTTNKELEEKVKLRTKDLEIALEKAKDAEKLISSFLSNLSHEIRTPMNAIIGFSQIVCSTDIDVEEKDKFAGIIENNVTSLLNQIDNIMEVAKLHTGKYKIVHKNFNISYLFKDVYNKLKIDSSLIKNNIDFNILINEYEDTYISSDEEAFRQIIYNLVENALKYTEKGTVEFGFKIFKDNDKETINIFVNDTGIGIKENSQKIIFNPFSKIEETKDKLHRGTGLGLALVKNLTEKLNGKIGLDSKPNIGTKITITIPLSL